MNVNEELNNLMLDLQGKDKIQAHQTNLLYNLNNIIFPDLKEFNKSCPSCRERIYRRLQQYWEQNIKNKN